MFWERGAGAVPPLLGTGAVVLAEGGEGWGSFGGGREGGGCGVVDEGGEAEKFEAEEGRRWDL